MEGSILAVENSKLALIKDGYNKSIIRSKASVFSDEIEMLVKYLHCDLVKDSFIAHFFTNSAWTTGVLAVHETTNTQKLWIADTSWTQTTSVTLNSVVAPLVWHFGRNLITGYTLVSRNYNLIWGAGDYVYTEGFLFSLR